MKMLIFLGFTVVYVTAVAEPSAIRLKLRVIPGRDWPGGGNLCALVYNKVAHLKDLDITDEKPQNQLFCTVVPVERQNGVSYAASFVFTSADGHYLCNILQHGDSPDRLASFVAHVVDTMRPELASIAPP